MEDKMELPERVQRCLNLVGATYFVPGDILELGVSTGVNSIALGHWIKQNKLKKKVYAFDTYQGLPYDGQSGVDSELRKGECASSFQAFQDLIKQNELENIVIPIQGLVENTLPDFLLNHKVSFVFLDMDLYVPTSFATKVLVPIMSLGSVIGYHDYGFIRCPGIKIVVDQELDHNLFRQLSSQHYDCAFFTKTK